MLQDLTLQQFCALDYRRNMVVTSGPGAGKTRILSHRFCFILLTDDTVTIPKILTLTFTEKAAEEMKGRIYEMLSQLDRDIEKRRIGDQKLKKRIRDAKEQFHKNRISTIHSFCANLLRDHPVEAGIDPEFVVIQGVRQRNVMEQAIEAGLSSVWQTDKDDVMPLLRTFGNRRNLLRALRNLVEHPLTLQRVIKTKERLFRIKGWESQVFRDYCQSIKDDHLIPYLTGIRQVKNGKGQHDLILPLLEDWYKRLGEEPDNFGLPDLFLKLRQIINDRTPGSSRLSVKDGLRDLSYLDLAERFFPDLFALSSPDLIFGKELNLFLKVATVCMERYRTEKERINSLDFADLEALCHDFLTDLFEEKDQQRLKSIQNRFRYVMVDEFQDTNRVQWEIISLLCSDKEKGGEKILQPRRLFVVGDKRQAIYGFRGGDVTVFESVTKKIRESNPEMPPRMFWHSQETNDLISTVQEGYDGLLDMHRKAFDALSGSERERILKGDIYLPHNFRTDSIPIAFFNKTFNQVFSNKGAGGLKEYETAPMPITMPDREKTPHQESGSVTFYLHGGSSTTSDQAEREASLVVDIIEAILGRHGNERFEYRRYDDIRAKIEKNQLAIGILFYAFTHVKTFESMLREAGLPFKVHRGKGFYRCEEVMEMIQLLSYLSDEREQISLLATLRSPIFALTDPEIFDLFYGRSVVLEQFLSSQDPYMRSVGKQIQSWRLLSSRLPLAQLIRTIIIDRGLTAIYSVHPHGAQRLANMEKLIEIARRFQSDGNGSLREFVTYCLEMAEEEGEEGEALLVSGGESPICLMTVHAAKGLEFPMVIMPNLDRRLPVESRTGKPLRLYSSGEGGPAEWNSEEGEIPVWQVEVPELGFAKSYSPLGYLLRERDRLEDIAENRRVFYVGCTRTKHHLVLLGGMKQGRREEVRRSLSSDDYRKRATIMELLDDVYGFALRCPPEKADLFEGAGDFPTVIWKELGPREFKGILYEGKGLTRDDFGTYEEQFKELDLTGAIRTPSYYQLSFKSIRTFKTCPMRFYYSVILGLSMNGAEISGTFMEGTVFEEDDEREDASSEALFVGNVIHRYLERHRFGDPLDEHLFNLTWGRLRQPELDGDSFDKKTLAILREKALRHLERTVCDERLIQMFEGQKDYKEVPFLFAISHGCEFRGVIDRLFKDRDKGHWVIIDWKSNDLKDKDPEEVVHENDYGLQLACYKWAVEHILHETVGDCYIYFTDRGHLFKSSWEGHPRQIVEEMLDKIRDYENDREGWVQALRERKRDRGDCRYCEYETILCKRDSRNGK
jgi:ATP-dependent helicase/nuclease subunit A